MLEELRKKIDEIDDKLLKLLSERVSVAMKIGEIKKKEGISLLKVDRENQILKRLIKNRGSLPKEAILSIYREIFGVCLKLQEEPKIGYLGPAASFTHQAAQLKFGSINKFIPLPDIPSVFAEVEKEKVNLGVIPIENSTEGVVFTTLDMLITSPLFIRDEIYLKISHCLLSKETDISKIKRVYSHPQVFAQCREWIAKNLLNCELIETSSTSYAADIASKEDLSCAIASKLAGELYNLNILAENIEDLRDNTTRFFVIGKEKCSPTGHDKTSILFSVKDRPGALHDMITPFAEKKINLTKIESRPSKIRPWDYMFFIDFEGHITDKNVEIALGQLEKLCNYLKILGSYPMGEEK